MGIRDALAAEGNAPLVFMGGTCAGPKWRERLCGQVSQSFRWFNPVVDEWSEEAKETELTVRAEADVMLYAITPYQEGCYSYLEMTEDAIRSEKPVVIAFLPSFEDKAFSEQQWSSIVSAKRLLERNNATVLLSMEELIDWFNRYNDKSPDGKMLDTAELLRKAAADPKPSEAKPAPVTAAGLVNAVQEERANEFNKPANAEPGTTPAVGDAGTAEVKTDGVASTESMAVPPENELSVSTEGIFDGLVGLIRGYVDEDSPGDNKDGKKLLDISWAREQKAAIERTFGNEKWVRANFKPTATIDAKHAARLALGGKVLKPADGYSRGRDLVDAFINNVTGPMTVYERALNALESEADKRIAAGEDGAVVAKDILTKVKKVKAPIPNNYTTDEFVGGYVLRFNQNTDKINRMLIEINPKGELAVPELSVDDVIAAGKQLVNVASDIDILLRKTPMAGSGCDTPPWTVEGSGFDYDSPTGEELQELFYFQGEPDVFNDFCNEPVFLLAGYVRQVGRWLQAHTR